MRGPVIFFMGGGEGSEGFFVFSPCSQFLAIVFPSGSQKVSQVPKLFPKAELRAPRFNQIPYDLPKVQLLCTLTENVRDRKKVVSIGGVPNLYSNQLVMGQLKQHHTLFFL